MDKGKGKERCYDCCRYQKLFLPYSNVELMKSIRLYLLCGEKMKKGIIIYSCWNTIAATRRERVITHYSIRRPYFCTAHLFLCQQHCPSAWKTEATGYGRSVSTRRQGKRPCGPSCTVLEGLPGAKPWMNGTFLSIHNLMGNARIYSKNIRK